MSTGMPAGIWLSKFGTIIADYFGDVPYHVGSSLDRKDWRDVDVRLILDDDEFERRFGTIRSAEVNRKLAAVTLAFCALGKEMTGLPIDFQIQPRSHANELYPGKRSALIELDTEPTAEPEAQEPDIEALRANLDPDDDFGRALLDFDTYPDITINGTPVTREQRIDIAAMRPAVQKLFRDTMRQMDATVLGSAFTAAPGGTGRDQ
jgi:hypothetical protein